MQGLVITVASNCFGGMKTAQSALVMLLATVIIAAGFDKIENIIIGLGKN